MTRLPILCCLVLAAAACSAPPAKSVAVDAAPQPPAPPQLPDSLVLHAPDGTELWLTDARAATAADGSPCTERVMELRKGAVRRPVPLLYTAEMPRLLNDTLAETHIYLHCKPGNLYRINLRSGQPIYVGLQ